MSTAALTWERQLLDWANEGLDAAPVSQKAAHVDADLVAAYLRCKEVTAAHSRTFFLASGLLPEPKRQAARALCLLPNQRRPDRLFVRKRPGAPGNLAPMRVGDAALR